MYIIADKNIFSLDTIKGVKLRGKNIKMVVTAKEAFNEIQNEYLIYEFKKNEEAEAAYDDLVLKIKEGQNYWDVKEFLKRNNVG